MTEDQIIDNVLAGRHDDYARLVKRYQDKIYGLCLTYLCNPTEAEETAQVAFIEAYKSLSNFNRRSKFSTWLYKIAYYKCQDQIRKRVREKSDSWEALLEQKGDQIQSLFLSPPEIENQNHHEIIDEILSLLSEGTGNLLKLREVEGYSYEEISQILDCSLDAVKGRLKRARQEVKEKARHFLMSRGDLIKEKIDEL